MSELNGVKGFIKSEKDGIEELLQSVDDRTERVINVLAECKGKVVFMGVGKSAHIGQKLAATFASTGTPSFFVHSTEAVHGDLGMIEEKDVAVLISNSGNTQEVVQDLPSLKKIGCKTVAFTSGENSKLAQGCDYLLLYPKCKESDDLGLAPTTSSTVTLVLGDAIACELSRRKKFTKENFFKYHPNGALGAALKTELEK